LNHNLKTILHTCLCFLGACLTGQSQVLLNAGESFTFEFTSLPLHHIDKTDVRGVFSLEISDWTTGRFLFEIFENNVNEAPIRNTDFPSGFIPSGAWQDLQGVARVTVFNGSVTLNSLSFRVTIPSEHSDPNLPPINYFVYQSTFPTAVPEPTVLVFVGLTALVGKGWRLATFRQKK